MKIRIIKCTEKIKGSLGLKTWYKDKIGEEFIVVDSTKWYYWVIYNNLDGKPCRNTVNVEDAKIL